MPEIWLKIFLFVVGAVVGSFLNVVILRLPRPGESIAYPASHCPKCQKTLRWYDNIPIVSYIFLRAHCRYCGTSISLQYPLVEITMGLLTLALYYSFSLSVVFAIYFCFIAALLVIIVIDIQHQIIPDVISLPGIVLALGLSFVNPLVTWQDSLLGILFGGGSLYLVAAGYYLITKREGMGGGDIKLLAMIGGFLGWQSLLFVIFSSSLLGTVVGIGAMVRQKKGGKTVVPYGPFLSVGAILFLFFRAEIFAMAQILFSPGLP